MAGNRAIDPDGRRVVFDSSTRLHLRRRRPELADETKLALDVVSRPDHREDDPRPGRERFYRRDIDPRRWLRVIVDFNTDPARIVTVLIQSNPPKSWNP
jgi:hypothetical protein